MTDDLQEPKPGRDLTENQFNLIFGLILLATVAISFCMVWAAVRMVLKFT